MKQKKEKRLIGYVEEHWYHKFKWDNMSSPRQILIPQINQSASKVKVCITIKELSAHNKEH